MTSSPLHAPTPGLAPWLAGRAIAAAAISLAAFTVAAQGLPPIYEGTPVQTAAATTFAQWDKGTFLENLAFDSQGRLYVNSYLDGKVYRVDAQGRKALWAQIDGTIAGIAVNADGSAVVSGWSKGKVPAVFTLDRQGNSALLLTLDGGQFPNGVVRLDARHWLVADSYKGVIWSVDARERTATVWLEDERLARADAGNPTPGVNGIKLHRGVLWATNTARQLLLKVPVVGGRAGAVELMLKDISIDDFDFDQAGNLYGATHVYNSLVRVSPQGQVTVLAGLTEGMAGSTAVATRRGRFGVEVYVSTNGGMSMPPEGGVQPGRVQRLVVAQP